VWKADRVLAGVTLSRQVGEFAAALTGLPGVRLAQDDAIWKPPSGKALLSHQDTAYLDHLEPPNMTTCWMALDIPPAIPERSTTSSDRGPGRRCRVPRGWTFHGSPPNERSDPQRSSIISHMISTDTRWNPDHPHPIYPRYRRPGEIELDEAFFPILWRDGYRTAWLDEYADRGRWHQLV
jgi:phytanoyl-CoA hydroxylase